MAKKMTAREKRERKKVREYLRKEGLLPERKKPLNRKKFVEEVREEYLAYMEPFEITSVVLGISFMLPAKCEKITAEQIGIAKLLKAIMEIDKLDNKSDINNIMENIIKPIKEL